jgi:hypothetical protein
MPIDRITYGGAAQGHHVPCSDLHVEEGISEFSSLFSRVRIVICRSSFSSSYHHHLKEYRLGLAHNSSLLELVVSNGTALT